MKTSRVIAFGVATAMALALFGCGGAESSEHQAAVAHPGVDDGPKKSPHGSAPLDTRPILETSRAGASEVANPADEHCVETGYRLEYVYEDGIPVYGLCINDAAGVKCTSWAYFREECMLDRKPN